MTDLADPKQPEAEAATAVPADSPSSGPSTEVRFMNLFLMPEQASAVPLGITFPYGDPFARDAELVKQGNRDTPIATAVVQLGPALSGPQLIPSIAWLSSILSFITRSPTYGDALVDRGGVAGGREEHLHTNIGLPRYGRRKGSRLFRMPADLRAFFDAAWPRLKDDGFEESGIPEAMEWHNFARGGHGIHYLDVQLAHHWIALEILAARWAKENRRDKLLNERQVAAVRVCLGELADREELDDADRQALREKAAELQRRPTKGVVLEYLRALFEGYPSQPVGEQLEDLLTSTISWRNKTVHDGSIVIHRMRRGPDGSTGIDRVIRGIRQLEGITARALLAELDSPLALLTDVPWTDWRDPA